MPKKKTTEEFKEQLSIEHPELELLSEYKGNKEYVTVRCIKHDYIFNSKPNWLHKGCGCQKCYDERRGKTLLKSTESFIKEAKKIHGDKYDYSKVDYKDSNSKVCIICPEHGEFWQTPDHHIQGEGCPYCNSSKLEFEIKKFLEKNSIKYESQKRFEWLGKQSLDFFLPDSNIAIECQGRQHFDKIEFFERKYSIETRIKMDITKNQLCQEHGIKILYVVKEEDLAKCFKKKFLGLYNDDNVIEEDKLDKIQKIQQILEK